MFHDRAWEGIKTLIVANAPEKALRLLRSISTARPSLEKQLHFIDSYDHAYRLCKTHRDFAFLMVHETTGESASPVSVFRELAAHHEDTGYPAFGIIIYDLEPKSSTAIAVGKTPNLLDYVHADKLLYSNSAEATLHQLWLRYVEVFEQNLLPKPFQESILAVAESSMGAEAIQFVTRLTTCLTAELKISWQEAIALKWAPFIQQVEQTVPALLKPHPYLSQMLHACQHLEEMNADNVAQLLFGELSDLKKIYALVQFLDLARRYGTLPEYLRYISGWSHEPHSEIIKIIEKNADRILGFSRSIENARKAG